MRPVVRAERVLHPAERVRPRLQRIDGVAQNAHDLGLAAGEALLERVQRGGLVVSGVGECEREEGEHHALAAIVRKFDLAPVVRPKSELWCDVADFQGLRLACDLRPTFS